MVNQKSNITEDLKHLAQGVSDLVLDPANARKHNKRNVEAIAASLTKFGQRKPIVVQKDGMVVRAGNGTLEAAKSLGWTHVAAVVLDDDNATASQFAIADNRTAELAEWDDEVLSSLLSDLDSSEQEMLGFDASDVRSLLASSDLVQDDVPGLPDNPVTKSGDLIEMGDHRLLCGDSTSSADVARLLDGAEPFLMVTDPPYGVEYDPKWRQEAGVSSGGSTGVVLNDERADWTEAWRLFPGVVAYVWHAGRFASIVSDSLAAAGLDVRSQIIWAKNKFALSRGNYHWQHEPCFYSMRGEPTLSKAQEKAVLDEARCALVGGLEDDHMPCWYSIRKNTSARWMGDRKQSTLWDIQVTDDNQKNNHGTQKPIECMGRPIRNHDTEFVYDPFLGSGTTLIAAEQLGRKCYGMEISPAYCDVIVKRWESLTGKQAVRGK